MRILEQAAMIRGEICQFAYDIWLYSKTPEVSQQQEESHRMIQQQQFARGKKYLKQHQFLVNKRNI